MKYNFWKGLRKSLVSVSVVGTPLVLSLLPQEWMNITLGGLAVLALNYIKVKYSK